MAAPVRHRLAGYSAALLVACCATACGEDAAPAVDAGVPEPDSGGGVAERIAPPAPPAEPALPDLGPCTDGWREVIVEEGVRVCDPWPETGRLSCPPGETHFPGEPGCAVVGRACPAGDWPDDLPATGVVYVLASAAAGGTGTREAPYASLGEATSAAASIIAVGKGTYDVGSVPLRDGVTLRGACARDTRIVSSVASTTAGVVQARGATVAVEDVTLGGARPGVTAVGPISLTVDGVVIDGATVHGIWAAEGATVTARSLVVRGTREIAGGPGDGIVAYQATVDLDRAVIERDDHVGAAVAGDAGVLRAHRVAILDSEPVGYPDGGGLFAFEGGRMEARHVVVERTGHLAIAAVGAGSSLLVEDVVIRDGRGETDAGRGLSVQEGATGVVSRLLVERARAIAVLVYGSASLTLSDVVVRDPLPNDAGIPNWQGRAIEAHMGARVDASRVLAVRAEGIGVWARGADTEMNIDDSVILDVSPGLGDGDKGWAVSVTEGARATFHRLRAERLTEVALQVQDAETSLMIEDVVVRDVAGSAASERLGSGGLAIGAFDGASVGVSRAIFERMSLGVVLNDEGTNGTFADVVVRYMTGEPRGGSYGRAMTIQFGAHALIQRAVLEDVRELALGAVGGEIEASDLVVRGVRGWLCSPELCGDPLIWAMGVGAYDGGHLEATRFSIADAVECGVQVGSGSSIDLHDGEVSRNRVGANVQEPTFDVARISDGVRYFDNELNLDATMQPVPDAYQPVAE